MAITKNAIPVRSSTIVEKMLVDDVILYNKENHTVHSLNTTAGILWNLADGKMSVSEMIDFLIKSYTGNKTVIENDVTKTLQEMEDKGLITFAC